MNVFKKIGNGLKDIGEAVCKTVKKVGKGVTDAGKNFAKGVGDFVKNIPDRVKTGFQAVGDWGEKTAKQFKNGAWVAGIGSAVGTAISAVGSVVNTATGGSLVGIAEGVVDSMDIETDENGNLVASAKKDANFVQKLGVALIGNPGVNIANTQEEIDEAIDEGNIKKANKYGGRLILSEAAMVGTAASAAVTCGGSSALVIAGTGLASAGLNMKNSQETNKSIDENMKDGCSDRANAILNDFYAKGYIDRDDKDSCQAIKGILNQYVDSPRGMSEDQLMLMIAMGRGKGELNISIDYFKDRYRDVDEIKNLCIDGDEASKEYQEKIIDALGKRDAYDISYSECERMMTQANYEYGYAENIKNGDMTKEQASKYAALDVAYEFGDINDAQYVKQQTIISLDNIAFTDAQKDAYADYAIAVSEGNITGQEMVDMLYEDPDFAMCFDENGVFTLPEIEKSEIEKSEIEKSEIEKSETNNIEMVNAEVSKADISNEQMSKNEIAAEWFTSYGSGANAFMETMYSKLLTTPMLGKVLAEKQVETMQKLGLQSSIIDLDDKSLSKEQLAEQLVEKAETILENKGMTQSTSDIDMQFAGI